MIYSARFTQSLFECRDRSLVGGKAASLGRLLRAGFAVPDGFAVTTQAYRFAQTHSAASGSGNGDSAHAVSHAAPQGVPHALPPEVAEETRQAYRTMGGGSVAVRSSATAEDMAGASMAGQYETFLDIVGEEALVDAVGRCWASLGSDRILAYLREHAIDPAAVAMAVVVQRLVPADVAGVLFTANPLAGTRREMLVEASWGLGESVVSGRVQPDVLRLEHDTGRVLSATIAEKNVQLLAGHGKETPVAEGHRRRASLGGRDVHRLWQLGRRVAEHFESPQDIEWAIHKGQLYLLQSRPITTLEEAEACEEVLRDTRAVLRERMAAGRGPFVLHNLAETLAHPTPFTWSVISRFMTGAGGFGAMYRQVGFAPSDAVSRDGFLEQLAGRIYMDASRAPEMFFENFPFAYDVEVLKKTPDASQTPPTLPRGSFMSRMKAARRLGAVNATLQQLSTDFDRQLTNTIFPAFAAWCAAEKRGVAEKRGEAPLFASRGMGGPPMSSHLSQKAVAETAMPDADEKRGVSPLSAASTSSSPEKKNMAGPAMPRETTKLSALSPAELVDLWHAREKKVLQEFAPQSLLPSLISGMALAELRTFLDENFWDEDPDELSLLISSGGLPDRTVIADAELYEVGRGTRPLETWIADHGHRAAGEFDLAAARWRERPQAAAEMASRLAAGDGPLDRHHRHRAAVEQKVADLRQRLAAVDAIAFDRHVDLVRRYVPFREDGKDFLMLGYELLRDVALEIGRRLEIGEDVFFLTLEDAFDALRFGIAPLHVIESRKRIYRAQAKVTLAHVIDATDIDKLGEVPEIKSAGGYSAFAVSSGQATGPARILRSPTEAGEMGQGYILVCPSTDPSWTPLFVNAAGLVLECGGTLSHGAVVAREMGLPAVVLPDATRLFQTGEQIQVDGRQGTVTRSADVSAQAHGSPNDDSSDEGLSKGGHKPLMPAGADANAASEPAKPRDDAKQGLTPLSMPPLSMPLSTDPDDTRIPRELVPPPVGRRERFAAKLRNIIGGVWIVYLLAAFLLDDRRVYQPSLVGLDFLLWPILRALGRPAVVAIVAGGLAGITLLIQKFMTDNPRLLEAKRRATLLTQAADKLPKGSRRRAAFVALASPVQWRTLMAAMVPVGILLGPMVMTFVWFTERVAPGTWNAAPGSTVSVVVSLDASAQNAWDVTIAVPAPLVLDDSTPAVRSVVPLRPTLERLLALYRRPHIDPADPWELKISPDLAREQTADNLKAYLDAGVPARKLTWLISSPTGTSLRAPISITAGKQTLSAQIVLGDQFPPTPATVQGRPDSPVKDVSISYFKAGEPPYFWKPFARFSHGHVPVLGRWAELDVGWLWVYVLAYVAILFTLRTALRIA